MRYIDLVWVGVGWRGCWGKKRWELLEESSCWGNKGEVTINNARKTHLQEFSKAARDPRAGIQVLLESWVMLCRWSWSREWPQKKIQKTEPGDFRVWDSAGTCAHLRYLFLPVGLLVSGQPTAKALPFLLSRITKSYFPDKAKGKATRETVWFLWAGDQNHHQLFHQSHNRRLEEVLMPKPLDLEPFPTTCSVSSLWLLVRCTILVASKESTKVWWCVRCTEKQGQGAWSAPQSHSLNKAILLQ